MNHPFELPRLFQTCDRCKGSGMAYCPMWAKFFDDMGNWRNNLALEMGATAPGHGQRAAGPLNSGAAPTKPTCAEQHACSDCGGLGAIPTIAGNQILEFINKFTAPRRSDFGLPPKNPDSPSKAGA